MRNGDYDEAIADCTEAIRLDPKCAEAYYRRGVVYDWKGESDKANADFAEAKKRGYVAKQGTERPDGNLIKQKAKSIKRGRNYFKIGE